MPERASLHAMVVTPSTADAELALQFLSDNDIDSQAFSTLSELCDRLSDHDGCVVLVEEALSENELPMLRDVLQRQPPWSDLPLILVAGEGAPLGAIADGAFPSSGNLTLLQRPLNPAMLVSAVRVALRARARQIEVRDLLAQRDEALLLRDEFLAMLAHELRNPLAPMRNAVYLQQKLSVDIPAFVRTRDILDRQVTHLSRMVDDLLDVARLEHGKVQLRMERVNLNELVAEATDACLSTVRARGHKLHVELAQEPLYVEADPVRLEQLIANLVGNAVKFTPNAGEIAVRTALADGAATVSVRDTGIGIRPEMVERIFDLFMQDDRSLARSSGGLGIGLTIAHRIAKLHGGRLQASSSGPNTGATFTAWFPLADDVPHASAPAAAHPPVQRRRVLIVEDNADIRESLSMILEMWGHDVVLAAEGERGLELAENSGADIALIDIGLPGMSGYDLARVIRSQTAPWSNIKLVAITGYGQPADRARAIKSGFDAHLLKPIDPTALQKVLAN